ncbi:helix-turn-helix domain-containing protein [Eubacterium aggregans]|uniref:helix-turn-helix domain-containing protein n=1 Tax=Eubacterium aggregans TaxID=81409 RepID=UPI003F2E41F0
MGLGDQIKSLRKKNKITQKELASELGVSLRTVQRYESGAMDLDLSLKTVKS